MGKTIAITGGVGHIGSNITTEALKRGWKVVVFDNLHREQVIENLKYFKKTYTQDQFEFVWGDVRNADDFDRLPRVDAIIHLAANPGIPWSIKWPLYDFETNARGTLNALQFARKCGNIPFAYASTNKTFSDVINTLPIEEKDKRYVWRTYGLIDDDSPLATGIDYSHVETNPDAPFSINENFPITGFGKYGHSLYGISKLTGDLYVQEYHCQYKLPVVINKMSCIFGLFQKGAEDQGFISHFVQTIGFGDGKLNFFGNGKQVRDLLDARDVARLYMDEVEQIDKCNGEIFTVGGGPDNTKSLVEIVNEIEKQTNKKAEITYFDKRPADQDIYISSLKHVREVMDWKPTIKFEQTISDMIKEYSS